MEKEKVTPTDKFKRREGCLASSPRAEYIQASKGDDLFGRLVMQRKVINHVLDPAWLNLKKGGRMVGSST